VGDCRDKPGDDESAVATFAPLTRGARKALSELTKKRVFRFAQMPNPIFSGKWYYYTIYIANARHGLRSILSGVS
jgi:hypothetical protein